MTLLTNTSATPLVEDRAGQASIFPIKAWLFIIAGLVFAMVLVGGATRLTGSGLSITEWQPILGAIPPFSEAAWQDAFAKYRQIPEYELINKGMSLEAFKAIYWWEWTHRLLGRLIGFVFFIPFVYFLARKRIPNRFIIPVAALFVLGGSQGALGWFMVKSGLSDRVDVSQYRLAAHLALAVAIGGYAFWLGLSIRAEPQSQKQSSSKGEGIALLGATILAALVYLQIIAGAFVAGLKAGHASNSWPLMNGEIIPFGLDVYSPWYINFFENPLTAQFTHRAIAYLVLIAALLFSAIIARSKNARYLRTPLVLLNIAIVFQVVLGIATIVYDVPIGFALAHQANAIVVFGLSLWTLRRAVSGETYAAARA